jgi:ATP-dependent DNA ligase
MMAPPVPLDYPPMEAKSVDTLPEGPQWQYEPKWDGFRCLAFRDGDDVHLRSKAGQPLERYFPEIVAALQALPVTRCRSISAAPRSSISPSMRSPMRRHSGYRR